MRPWLFRWNPGSGSALEFLGDLSVPAYFFMIVVGFLVAVSLVIRLARFNGKRVIDILDLTLWVFGAGLVGSRLGHVFFNAPFETFKETWKVDVSGIGHVLCQWAGYAHNTVGPSGPPVEWNLGMYYLLHPHMVAAVWNGGVVFYGGVLLALPVGYWFCKRRGLNYWLAGDLGMPALLAGLAFGRGGCLMAGCCHGKPATGIFEPMGLVFHSSQVAGPLQGLPLHPTQMYESVAALAMLAVLTVMSRFKEYRGQLFVMGLGMYAVWRFINEWFRGDAARGVYLQDVFPLGISTSQIIAIVMVIVAIVLHYQIRDKTPVPFVAEPGDDDAAEDAVDAPVVPAGPDVVPEGA